MAYVFSEQSARRIIAAVRWAESYMRTGPVSKKRDPRTSRAQVILRATANEEIGPEDSGTVTIAGSGEEVEAHNRYTAETAVVAEDAVCYIVWSTQDQTYDILTADCG